MTTVTVTECDDFHSVEDLVALLAPDARHPNRIFRHDPARSIEHAPGPLRRGVSLFGDGQASEVDGWRFGGWPYWQGESRTREVFSFALDRGVLLPTSTAMLSGDHRLIYPSIEHCRLWGGVEHVEPTIVNVDGRLVWNPAAVDDVERTAVSIAGIVYRNYGHFLFDGLPLVYLLVNSIGRAAWEDRLALVGPTLEPWHHEILGLLNLDRFVLMIPRPTRFATLMGNSFLTHHVTFPTRFARPIFDALKFVVAAAPDAPEKIYIVRTDQTERVIRNVDQLVERLRKRGYVPIAPERYSVREQIRMFSRARIVVGPTSSAFANVGFAPPRAKILEIMAECQPDQWIRRFSFLLGHRWHVYVARVDTYTQRRIGAGPLDLYEFSFDLPLDDFERALDTVEAV